MEVSGPGAMSKRTDRQPVRDIPNADYGEQKALNEQQTGAPMAASGDLDFSSLFGSAASRVIPMGAGTAMPSTPVTDGADAGAGRGMEALGLTDQSTEDLKSLIPNLPVLEYMANQTGASWAIRNLVRRVKALQ